MSSKEIEEERRNLMEELEELDENLGDFFALLEQTVSYKPDYSLESIKYVELLLRHLKVSVDDDSDLLIDTAFYVGETIRRHFNGTWDISVEPGERYSQPVVRDLSEGRKDFYPFLSANGFARSPEIGYFLKWL